jgi:outer membrane receptor protein involved in Fe transport
MFRRLCVSATLLLLCCFAQETSEITGRVIDASGAVVADAAVEVRGVQTGVKWSVVTNADGYYTQALLPPAEYQVTVSVPGFKQEVRKATLEMSQVARIDFALQMGSQTETVQVMATAPQLEASNASIGQVIDTQPINDLPLNGRNYLDLAKLTIGVTEPSGYGTSGTTGDRAKNGGAFIANGTRSDQNNFILDGIDNNSKIPDLSSNSNVVVQPSVDAIGEFKVETNTYSPEYGHSGGAVLSVTTKTGTNQVHGSAFEFLRNDKVDARNFFLPASEPKQELRQNQYGATLGGPIVKNKTFLFGSWQGSRQNSGSTYVSTLPSAAMISGNFSSLLPKTITDPAAVTVNADGTFNRPVFPGNVIPQARFSQTSSLIDQLIPATNVAGAANNYVSSPVAVNARDAWDTRGDQNFSEKDRLFLRYSYYKLYFYNPGPLPSPLVGSTSFQQSINNQSGHQAALGETHVFAHSLVTDFHAGYNRISNALRDFVDQDLDAQYGFGYIPPHPNMTGLPAITLTGYAQLGEAAFLPDTKGSDAFQVTDSLLWTKGKHYFKLGGEYLWHRSRFDIDGDARGLFAFNGQFTGNAFSDYLLGFPNQETLNSELIGDLRYKYYGAYIADDWKVTPKLTLNLGIRWEYEAAPFSTQNLLSNFVVGPNQLIFPNNNLPPTSEIPASLAGEIPPGVDPRALVKNYKNNWAPRAGVAYQLFEHTVIRAGGGIFIAESDAAGASTRPVSNPPFKATYNPPAGNGVQPTFSFASGFPVTAENPALFNQSSGALIGYNPNERPATIYKWSTDVQQEIDKFLLDVGYVGTKGTHLAVAYNINQAIAGAGTQASRFPFQGFNTITYQDAMGNSEYDALQVRVERRWSSGLSLLVSYTWSKSIDLGNGSLIADLTPRNAMNVGWERAVSSGSVPQRFVTSYSYALPIGHGRPLQPQNRVLEAVAGNWQVNGITTIRDGQPFTPATSTNSANTNGRNAPNWNPAASTPGFTQSVNDWFDVAAFSLPVLYTYGNEGRDILRGPGAINFDASFMKTFDVTKLRESARFQLRFEGFNIFNHPNFAIPSNVTIGTAGVGSITTTTTGARILQAGAKLIF